MVTNGPIEPAADLRAAAKIYFGIFTALQQEGFTEQQALVVVGQIIQAQIGNS